MKQCMDMEASCGGCIMEWKPGTAAVLRTGRALLCGLPVRGPHRAGHRGRAEELGAAHGEPRPGVASLGHCSRRSICCEYNSKCLRPQPPHITCMHWCKCMPVVCWPVNGSGVVQHNSPQHKSPRHTTYTNTNKMPHHTT